MNGNRSDQIGPINAVVNESQIDCLRRLWLVTFERNDLRTFPRHFDSVRVQPFCANEPPNRGFPKSSNGDKVIRDDVTGYPDTAEDSNQP